MNILVGWISACAIHQRNVPQLFTLAGDARCSAYAASCVGGWRKGLSTLRRHFGKDLASYKYSSYQLLNAATRLRVGWINPCAITSRTLSVDHRPQPLVQRAAQKRRLNQMQKRRHVAIVVDAKRARRDGSRVSYPPCVGKWLNGGMPNRTPPN